MVHWPCPSLYDHSFQQETVPSHPAHVISNGNMELPSYWGDGATKETIISFHYTCRMQVAMEGLNVDFQYSRQDYNSHRKLMKCIHTAGLFSQKFSCGFPVYPSSGNH